MNDNTQYIFSQIEINNMIKNKYEFLIIAKFYILYKIIYNKKEFHTDMQIYEFNENDKKITNSHIIFNNNYVMCFGYICNFVN